MLDKLLTTLSLMVAITALSVAVVYVAGRGPLVSTGAPASNQRRVVVAQDEPEDLTDITQPAPQDNPLMGPGSEWYAQQHH